MQRAWRCLAAVLGRVIFIGLGIQIVLGILWMCSAFTNLQGFVEGIVCVGQILLAGCAAYYFLRGVGVRRWYLGVFGSLAIVTFPMAMQCHMSVGVRSVISSALLLSAGWTVRAGRKWKLILRALLSIAVGGLIAFLVIFGQEGQSLGTCRASRFAWTTIYESYDNWSKGLQRKVGFKRVKQSSYEPCGIRKIIVPRLIQKVGAEEAEKLYKRMAKVAWKHHSDQIKKEIAWDAAGYLLAPVVLPMQLKGRAYASYSGANYRELLQPAPRLGKWYMNYGCWMFQVGVAITVFLSFFRLRKIGVGKWIAVFLPGVVMAGLYTMSGAGQMDYRNTVYLACVGIAAMFMAAERCER